MKVEIEPEFVPPSEAELERIAEWENVAVASAKAQQKIDKYWDRQFDVVFS